MDNNFFSSVETTFDKKALRAIIREIQKLHSHLFENQEIQFVDTVCKLNGFLDKGLIKDSTLTNHLLECQQKLNELSSRFMSLELEMLFFKNNLLSLEDVCGEE